MSFWNMGKPAKKKPFDSFPIASRGVWLSISPPLLRIWCHERIHRNLRSSLTPRSCQISADKNLCRLTWEWEPIVSIPIAHKSQVLAGVSGFCDEWKRGFPLQHRERRLYCETRKSLLCEAFWLSDNSRWRGTWKADGKIFPQHICPLHQVQKCIGGNKREHSLSVIVDSSWKVLAWERAIPFRNAECKTFSSYNHGNLFPFNIKQVYSCGPVGIDSASLFTCVKKQMALTYLMLGGGEGGRRVHASLVLCVFLVQASGILFALVLFCLSLLPFSPSLPLSLSLARLSSARSQPRCRQEVRPCHSALPAVSAGSPSQITPPTVQYLKKSSILFVWYVHYLFAFFPPPLVNLGLYAKQWRSSRVESNKLRLWESCGEAALFVLLWFLKEDTCSLWLLRFATFSKPIPCWIHIVKVLHQKPSGDGREPSVRLAFLLFICIEMICAALRQRFWKIKSFESDLLLL